MASNLTLQRRSQRAAEESAAFGPIAERFRRAGDLDRAVSLCREGLQKFPHHISARVTLGWSLLDQGKYDEARVELEQVLRRAPDNLAAIRGLAELHDRAEHTMNLPMDGPGQWPPTEESLNDAAPQVEAFDPEIVRDSPPTDVDAIQTAVRFAEAEEETPAFDVQIRPDAPAVFTSSSGAALKTEPEPVAAKVAEPVAYAAAPVEEPIAQEAAFAQPAALEPSAIKAIKEDAVVAEEPVTAEADLVSESDIAALLAEAERLEAAAAEIEGVAESSDAIDVAGEIDLEANADVLLADESKPMAEAEPVVEEAEPVLEETEPVVAAVAEPIAEEFEEPAAEVATEAIAEPVAEVEVAVEAAAEPVTEEAEPVLEENEPVVAAVAEAPVEEVADPAVEEVPEPVAAIAEEVAEPVAEEIPEPIAAAPSESVEEDAAEPVVEGAAAQAITEPVAAVVEEPVTAIADRVAPAAAQTVVEFDARSRNRFDDTPGEFGLSDAIVAAALQSSVAHMHLAEIMPMARAARSDPHASALVKLERFLAQVQARRRELMRQSVA